MGIIHWFMTVRPQNYLTAPIIYGMAVPMVLFDLGVTFYQWTCFSNLWNFPGCVALTISCLTVDTWPILNFIEKI